MGGIRHFIFCAVLAALPVVAQEADPELDLDRTRVVPPAVTVAGTPNPAYGKDLEARVQALHPNERKAFFKQLRKQQRDLERRIEEMVFNYDKAKSLKRDISPGGTEIAARAADLVETDRTTILRYKEIERHIQRVRERQDPQRVDALDFQADLYAGLQFSSLYSEQDTNSSFFSTSKPFVTLDLRNTFRWPGADRWMDVFGTLSFEASSKESSDAVNVITTSGNFKGEMGAWWMEPLTENMSWGLLGSVGLVGYSQPAATQDLAAANRDQFRTTVTLGLTMRQETGPMRTSFAEIAYVRDPLFLDPNRLLIRGQVVLTQFGSRGANGDFYMEGRASKARVGRDEAVLLLGMRLSTLSFFRSLGGGG